MDPTIVLMAWKFFFRRWARSVHEDAFQDQRDAQRAYADSYQRTLAEQQACLAACHALADNRQATLDIRWSQLHTFLVASGINGGLFAPPRRVFGKRSEEEVRSLLSGLQRRTVGNSDPNMRAVRVATPSAALIQGLRWLDAHGEVDIPVLHQSLRDIIRSPGDPVGSEWTDAMGVLADAPVGEALGEALDLFSFAVSGSIFASASQCWDRADRLRAETERLDEKRAGLEAANQRIAILLAELDQCSYELFKWTVVAQEAARLQRAARGRKRNVSDLPRWILHGLLRKATQLWGTFDHPVFPSDADGATPP